MSFSLWAASRKAFAKHSGVAGPDATFPEQGDSGAIACWAIEGGPEAAMPIKSATPTIAIRVQNMISPSSISKDRTKSPRQSQYLLALSRRY
jgi:hypothetical protein